MEKFLHALGQHFVLSEADEQYLRHHLPVIRLKKGAHLLQEGAISRSFYFLLSGCCRMYYLVDGLEKNTCFYTEGQFVSSYESFVRQKAAVHSIACAEDCEVVEITQSTAMQLLETRPHFERISRIIMEEELITYQQMLADFITQNPTERYQAFSARHPDLLQRLPQYHIASYLGVNAETLSRIRKRLAQ